jgi:dolichyl-phosphate-mannose--protein O-mannosyl transferase
MKEKIIKISIVVIIVAIALSLYGFERLGTNVSNTGMVIYNRGFVGNPNNLWFGVGVLCFVRVIYIWRRPSQPKQVPTHPLN